MASAPPGGMAGAPASPASDPAHLIAQLAAMPPKQAMALVQMNMAQAQQAQNPAALQLWQQVAQALQAGMMQQQGEQQNPVQAVLGGQYG